MRSIGRNAAIHIAASLGTANASQTIAEYDGQAITIESCPKIPRMIERIERAWADEIATSKERRQWNKPAKKPKALRGRP